MPNLLTFVLKNIVMVFLVIGLGACNGADEPGSDSPSSNTLKPYYFAQFQTQTCCTIIAHAGGAVDGNSYTNSREAIERNYEYGTRMFELDFELTRDGHWVAVHDWPNWKNQTGFQGELPPTRAEFMETQRVYKKISWSIEGRYSPVDLDWLETFLKAHSDATIVTDIKTLDLFGGFVDVIQSQSQKDQFIFQAYSLEDVQLIKDRAPDAKIILTLYRIGYPAALFTGLEEHKAHLIGITLPMSWAYIDSVTERLLAFDVPLYLHGAPANINSRSLQADFAAKGISGFYLD